MFLDKKDSKEFTLKLISNQRNSNHVDEKNDKSIVNAKVNVKVTYAYTSEVSQFNDIQVKLVSLNTLLLNDLLEELTNRGCSLINSSVSYFDSDLNSFIYCGILPFSGNVLIPYQTELGKDQVIQIKSRLMIKKESLMRMELIEETAEQGDESNQNLHINVKSKRSKERKIGYIIEKVFLWRKLYNGFLDDRGNLIKLTLEEAADRVGISKKSLDDYLIQLRIGKQHDFVFNEHKNDKVGVLRAFVKKHKYEESKGHYNSQFNIMTSPNPNITFNGNYGDYTGK